MRHNHCSLVTNVCSPTGFWSFPGESWLLLGEIGCKEDAAPKTCLWLLWSLVDSCTHLQFAHKILTFKHSLTISWVVKRIKVWRHPETANVHWSSESCSRLVGFALLHCISHSFTIAKSFYLPVVCKQVAVVHANFMQLQKSDKDQTSRKEAFPNKWRTTPTDRSPGLWSLVHFTPKWRTKWFNAFNDHC